MIPCSDTSFNIVIGEDKSLVKVLFFDAAGTEEPVNFLPANTRLPQLLKAIGVFASANQAKANGFDREIPPGFSELTLGKRKIRICIWNPIADRLEDALNIGSQDQ